MDQDADRRRSDTLTSSAFRKRAAARAAIWREFFPVAEEHRARPSVNADVELGGRQLDGVMTGHLWLVRGGLEVRQWRTATAGGVADKLRAFCPTPRGTGEALTLLREANAAFMYIDARFVASLAGSLAEGLASCTARRNHSRS